MRRSLALALLVAIVVCGCQKVDISDGVSAGKVFLATVEAIADDTVEVETKTSMDESGNVRWKRGDQVSIFAGSALNEHYQVTDASDGKTTAVLNRVESTRRVAGDEISVNVAFYPYAATAAIARSGSSYMISDIALPATQNYAAASFGNGAFPMVAVTRSARDEDFKFKNVLGGLKLQLKGTAAITSVSITGNNKESLCGAASVSASNTAVPAVSLTAAGAKRVTLDCGRGVQLNAETATAFIIALPPMTMSGGFTVTVTDSQGNQMEIKTTKSQTIIRSRLLTMPAVNYVGVAPGPDAAVDLGLPSGLKWASCNLCEDGFVSSPEESGDYYAWGETEPYYTRGHSRDEYCHDWKDGKSSGYVWASYSFELGTNHKGPFSKYVTNSDYGTVDNKNVLDLEDDAARQTLGGNWRMPTDAEWTELRTECNWTETTLNGVYGYLVTGSNRNSIVLPIAGCRAFIYIYDDTAYWSSSLDTDYSFNAWLVSFGAGGVYRDSAERFYGQSIRPVYPTMDSQGR